MVLDDPDMVLGDGKEANWRDLKVPNRGGKVLVRTREFVDPELNRSLNDAGQASERSLCPNCGGPGRCFVDKWGSGDGVVNRFVVPGLERVVMDE